MVLNGFQGGTFLGASLGQLDEGLHDAGEQLVAPESARFQVSVHPALLPRLPKLHQLVYAVDEGRRVSVRRRLPEVAAAAAVP